MSFNESDTRAKLIDPAIHGVGWTEDLIKREETAGAIQIVNGKPRRISRGRIDYTLRVKVNSQSQPVAVALIEAKAEHLPPTHGLEQGKQYADSKRLNVPFVFSTNGHLFVEYDRTTGLTSSPKPLTQFPSPQALQSRYEQFVGFKLSDEAAKPLLTRYAGGEATRRYYQDAAIRAVLEKIAKVDPLGSHKRALLSLATGAGKTFIAVNLLKRIADAGQLKRALFVCDRDELRTQGHGALQNVFGNDVAIAGVQEKGSLDVAHKNARVIVATHQTLGISSEDDDASFLTTHYPENYFSHIIIDECHRSAWGKWSQVLERNPDAVQIGLTATPRQLKLPKTNAAQVDEKITADNLKHFGEPVYEYDIGQGIEDGYLAACEIIQGRVNIDQTGLSLDQIMALGPTDAKTGQHLTKEQLRELYDKTDYEDRILLPDRVQAMCENLFAYLLATGGPEQKTIVFCARDSHADRVAITMNNLYAVWCKVNGKERVEPYGFKCTAANSGGDYLPDFRGSNRHHFIATTVDLLTTGVDVPSVRNVVFFKYVQSPISFYQMVGRGTRLDVPSEKLMFRVYDYTNATRLFGEGFLTRVAAPTKPRVPGEGVDEEPLEPTVVVEGVEVKVSNAGRFIVTQVDGKAIPVTVEEYRERLAKELVAQAPTLDIFRQAWVRPDERRTLLSHLPDGGRSALLMRFLSEMNDFDLYDVLAELGYGLGPLTRENRAQAFTYKNELWLSGMQAPARATIEALARQFSKGGTDGLENPQIFQTPELKATGGLPSLKLVGKPAEMIQQTKERMFAV